MPFNLGGPELIIVLVIVLIVFGAGKLPSVMKDVGRGVKEFKKAQTEEEIAASQAAQAAQGTMNSSSTPGATNGATTTGAATGTTTSAPRPTEPAPHA